MLLKTVAAALVVLGSASWLCAAYAPADNNRVVLNFDRDWKFIRQDVPGADNPTFDDSTWTDVGLPHCYNDQDTFDKPNDPDHVFKNKPKRGTGGGTGNRTGRAKPAAGGEVTDPIAAGKTDVYDPKDPDWTHRMGGDGGWGGKTWYRKHFSLDPKYQGREIFIDIEAARTVAEVWINGHYLGKYVSGFSSFAYDLTPYVSFTGDNVLSVMVDNTSGENIAAGNLSHWQPVLGGLYRNVYLYVTDRLHVTLPYYSDLKTEGVYVDTLTASEQSASIRMTTETQNLYADARQCELTTEVVDADGKVVLTQKDAHEVPPGGLYKFDQTAAIRRPHLWSLDTPYLYTVYSTLRSGGTVTDVASTTLGIRTIGFDNDKSRFLINGQPVILHGWGQKPENAWPGLGAGLPDWLLVDDMKMMKAGNGNIVRWGHCAGPVAELDEGDKIGFLNWQANISGETDYKGAIWDGKMSVFRDILIRDRNHPSICWWEGNNKDVSAAHTKQMHDLVHQWDWINPRPFADRRPISDASAPYNDFSIEENASKNSIPGKAMVEAEFYRPETDRRAWDADSPPGLIFTNNEYWVTEQDAMRGIVKDWKGIVERGGGVKWHFTDDTTHDRLGTYSMARLSGSMDATRLPKDIYYGLKVLYAEDNDPQIHIMGHWNYTKTHTIDVYSNCDEVELLLNDKSLGKKPVTDWCATWENVQFVPGTIKAIGYNAGSPDCWDQRTTAGPPAKIVLEVQTDPDGMKADREDVALVTATIQDKDGNPHPLADNKITFAVDGPANYRGGYNDYIPGSTGKSTLVAEAGKIRVALRSTDKTGKVTVTATSDGLEAGTISFDVGPVETADAGKN